MNPIYLDTARLLTQVAPLVFVETFALRGGSSSRIRIRRSTNCIGLPQA